MTDCRLCDEEIQAGDLITRLDVLEVIEDPHGEGYWGSPIGDNLRPVEETAERQYAHVRCIRSDSEPKRTNARVIDPEEIDGEGDPDGE